VCGKEDAPAQSDMFGEQSVYQFTSFPIQTSIWFVKEQKVWSMQQGTTQGHTLNLSTRECSDPFMCTPLQANTPHEFVHPLLRMWNSIHTSKKEQVLHYRQFFVEVRLVANEANATANLLDIVYNI